MANKKRVYNKGEIKRILDIDIYPRGGGKIDLEKFIDTVDHIDVDERVYMIYGKEKDRQKA